MEAGFSVVWNSERSGRDDALTTIVETIAFWEVKPWVSPTTMSSKIPVLAANSK